MGIGKDGGPKESFERGMEFHAKCTVFSEGCRGQLSKQLMSHFHLNADNEKQGPDSIENKREMTSIDLWRYIVYNYLVTLVTSGHRWSH